MALFNIGGPKKIHPLFEVPGKIYIFGQAHDASTLTPIFGDFLRGRDDPEITATAGYMGVEAIGLSSDSFVDKGIISPVNAYFYPQTNELSSFKMWNSLPVGDGFYISVSGGKRKLCTATKYDADGVAINSVSLQCMAASIVHEDELNLYCVGTSVSRPAGAGWSVFSINKNNLAVGIIRSVTMAAATSGIYMSTAYPIAKDYTGVTLIAYDYSSTGSSGGSPTATQYATNPNRSVIAIKISNGGIVTKTAAPVALGKAIGQVSSAFLPNDGAFIKALYETDESIVCGYIEAASGVVTSTSMLLFTVDKQSLLIAQLADLPFSIPDQLSAVWNSQSGTSQYRTQMQIHCVRDSVDNVKFLVTSYSNTPSNLTYGSTGTAFTLSMTITKGDAPTITIDHIKYHRSNAGATAVQSLNDAKDQFFVSYNAGGGDFLQLNPVNGEVLTKNSVEFPIYTGVVDQVGRFWAQDDATGSLHLYGPTTSATLRVSFDDSSLTYMGSPFITKLSVSAFNHMGDRVVNNVRLTLEGNSATFADGGISTTISTEAAGDAEVQVRIVGNGFVRVAASLAV